jgi:hypothetical protein
MAFKRSPSIFLCYRRKDRPAHALSIAQFLRTELGEENLWVLDGLSGCVQGC